MTPPAPDQAWAKQEERGSPFLIRFIAWLARTAGRRPTRLLLHPICLYFLAFAPTARRSSAAYLARVFGRPARLGEVYRHLYTFAATILDRVFFLTDRADLFDLRFEGLDELRSARAQGRGVILLGAHFGSFDAMRALASGHADMPLKVLMYTGPDSRVARVIHEINPAVADSIIPLGGTDSMLKVRDWLAGGGMVGILGDRITHGDKTWPVDFLGGTPHMPGGPWLLAALTGAPVVMFGGLYRGGNRYVIRFHRLSDGGKLPRAGRTQAVGPQVQNYARVLEAWVREAPYNWFNFYDYWA